MKKEEAFQLFDEMIAVAKTEMVRFTTSNSFSVQKKADESILTACDQHIDNVLTKLGSTSGLIPVSEEGDEGHRTVESGTYLTIDPIDGSLGYVEHVNWALNQGDIHHFLRKDLGPASDFCLLLGIVIQGRPRFGCCYHYVTREKILLDSESPTHCIIENDRRFRSAPLACYRGKRKADPIQEAICRDPEVEAITQATLGLKSLYTIINDHEQAVTIHRVQIAGLWDILPTAVAIQAFGGTLLDDTGANVVYDTYSTLPGKGATVFKGDRFRFVQEELKDNPGKV